MYKQLTALTFLALTAQAQNMNGAVEQLEAPECVFILDVILGDSESVNSQIEFLEEDGRVLTGDCWMQIVAGTIYWYEFED